MTINFVHICEHAFFSEDKKLSVLEIFDTINASSFPANHSKLSLAINVSGRMTSPVKVIIKSPSHQEVLNIPFPVDTFPVDKENNNILIHALGIQFTEQGPYKIVLKEGDAVVSPERNDTLFLKLV